MQIICELSRTTWSKRRQKLPRQQPPLPFWNSVSYPEPSSSLDANEWGSETIARGWANCLWWSSHAERLKLFQSAKEPTAKAKRYRLYPTAEDKKILVKWIGAARWTYNECLRAIMNEGVPRSKKALRARAINKEVLELLKKPWLEETPYDIRNAAMDDLLKAFASEVARSGTALASRRASSSTASTGCGAVGSTPFEE
ncbi:uncharacterized protein V1513DRAFT_460578 [Lipomyces chichibuensis]|uniref:uncharacterized protein n=1 Tax=Lipomyces chichibuensis TaxID=1546026 RepID=UPI00334354FA